MRKSPPVALLLVGVLAVSGLAWEMAPHAAAKVDPRLVLLYKDPADLAYGLGKSINIQGPSIDQAVVSVLVKTAATDAELEQCGAEVSTRLGHIVTARIPVDRLEELASIPHVVAIEASYKLFDVLDVSVPECGGADVHTGSPAYTGAGVMVGLLDTGIDPTHPDFLDATGKTRVLYIWNQWDGAGPPPSGYTYGREWTKAQIDAGQCTMNDPGAHGSHCAGIAAGDGSSSASGYVGMAPDANLVVVSNYIEDLLTYGYAPPWYATSSTFGSLDGLAYMQDRAQSEGMPLVVSWSQGAGMGPHDGSTLLEQAVDEFIATNDVPVVIAAGNEQLSDRHARGSVTTATPLVITFNTGTAGVHTPNADVFFELWYSYGDRMTVQIAPPGAGWGPAYGPDETSWPEYTASNGDKVRIYSTSDHPVSHKGYFLIWLHDAAGVGQGDWRMRVTADNDLPQGGQVDMWFERTAFAYCVDHVSYETTLTMPGSAGGAITVGAYNTKLQWQDVDGWWWYIPSETLHDIASFSSNGPTADLRQKPDISAPGQVIASVLSSGASPFYLQDPTMRAWVDPDEVHVLMAGTSMAAPHVAGAVALMLEREPNLGHQPIKQILTATARTDQYTGSVWNKAFGWGKLDAKAAVDAVGEAVDLASFTASAVEGAVRLEWQVADQRDHAGFHLYRCAEPELEGMTRINATLIRGNSYTDGTVLPGTTYYYWLEDVDVNGLGNVHGPVEATTVGGPATVWLGTPRPNPTSGPVSVRFCVPRAGEASVALYNMVGRKVASLVEAKQVGAGWQDVRWGPAEGTLAAGRYLCKLSFEGAEAGKPVVVVR